MTDKKDDATDSIDSEENVVKREKLDAEIQKLTLLDEAGYQLARKAVAKEFSIPAQSLDKLITNERRKTKNDNSPGGEIIFPQVEPWPEKVSGDLLLSELVRIIKKFVTLGNHEASACALWIVFTYCIDSASVAPILNIYSPEKRCGKSTLLSLIGNMVNRPLLASNISPAAIYRTVEIYNPCLLLDEVDTFVNDEKSELRGIINSGHTRSTAFVIRTVGENHDPRRFSTWCAKCLAGIGNLPDTIKDRSIPIKLRRRLKDENVENFRYASKDEIYNLQSQCVRFVMDNPDICKSRPTIPIELNDRAADSWEPLFQIATFAGTEWLKRTTEAALALSGIEIDQEIKSLGIELLGDIQNIFNGKYQNRAHVATVDLIKALCEDDEAPWTTYAKYRKDPQITSRELSNLLKPYCIRSKNIGRDRLKGYIQSDFQDAFLRYIHTQTPNLNNLSAHLAQPSTEASFTEKDASAQRRSQPLAAHALTN